MTNRSRVRDRYILTIGMILALVVAGAIWHFSAVKSSAQSPGPFFGFAGFVAPDTANGTQTLNPPSAVGSFSQLGIITGTDGGSGVLRRTGTRFVDGSVVVNDQYDLRDFNGAMSAQGTLSDAGVLENGSLLGLTGAIGTFKFNHGGVVTIQVLDPTRGRFKMLVSPTF